jgi:hypothetical protein
VKRRHHLHDKGYGYLYDQQRVPEKVARRPKESTVLELMAYTPHFRGDFSWIRSDSKVSLSVESYWVIKIYHDVRLTI